MGFHVASGREWHGRETKQGPVIYIAGEGHGGLARRFAAWQKDRKTPLDRLNFFASEQAAQLYNEESALKVVDAVKALISTTGAPSLIIIDTLARNFGSGDENSTNDMNVFIDRVETHLRSQFNATVLLVHHTGHQHKQRARGAMALKGGVDFEYRLERVGPDLTVRLSNTKMKDGPKPPDFYFQGRLTRIEYEARDALVIVFRVRRQLKRSKLLPRSKLKSLGCTNLSTYMARLNAMI